MPTDALSSDDPIETLARCLDFVKGILHQVASKGDKMHPLADVKGVGSGKSSQCIQLLMLGFGLGVCSSR